MRAAPALLLVCAAVLGCGSDLDPKRADARYACATTADCTTGNSCVCGFCQPLGAAATCLGGDADATDVADSAVTSDAADTTDSVVTTDTADTVDAAETSGPCSPRTWQGCGTGEGCYVDTKGAPYCLATGAGKLGQACDFRASTPPCGRDTGKPLICDSVEKKCQPLCDSTKKNCPNGWQCYPLGSPAWPDNAGVCAP